MSTAVIAYYGIIGICLLACAVWAEYNFWTKMAYESLSGLILSIVGRILFYGLAGCLVLWLAMQELGI